LEIRRTIVQPLLPPFYQPSAKTVAPLLLGHLLLRNTPEGLSGGPIVEAEAYLANDPACHAFGGETPRNRSMWGAPGRAYVYLIYGYHFCFNAVCRPPGAGEAVLIRAIEPAIGKDWMRHNRPVPTDRELTNGPAKLCQALVIDRSLDGINLCDSKSPLFVAENADRKAFLRAHGDIESGPRVGISKAADWPLRFFLRANPFVSGRRMAQR
jgi:DNA-3-methyladenine glycosylase